MKLYEPDFARYYDYLVHNCREAYAKEQDVDFLIKRLEEHSVGRVEKILDVGCGTGRYLVPLAKRGFEVTGLDNSPEMLAQCRQRLDMATSKTILVEQDLMEIRANHEYDALLCMNSVICYLLKTEEILKALSIFKRALRQDGVLVLEIWNIFANTSLFEQTSVHEIRDDQVVVTNKESYWYESFSSVFHTKLDVTVEENGETRAFTREEILRVMTVGEVITYLKAAGFAETCVVPRSDGFDESPKDEELLFFAMKP